MGAYGPNAAALREVLASPRRGRGLVDRERHAVAFARAPGPGSVLLPDLLDRLELGRVLNLGCGTGELLTRLASRDRGFRGWGVDASPAMIRLAEERLRASSAAPDQVRFYVGDVSDLTCSVPADVLLDVGTAVATSLVNEFFDPDISTAVHWLRSLSEALSGRVLVVADSYGALATSRILRRDGPSEGLGGYVARRSQPGPRLSASRTEPGAWSCSPRRSALS